MLDQSARENAVERLSRRKTTKANSMGLISSVVTQGNIISEYAKVRMDYRLDFALDSHASA